MELAIETIKIDIDKFVKKLKWLNPTAISLSFVDLLLGLLSISFIELSTVAVISSFASVTAIIAIYSKFKSLKKQAEKLGVYADQLLKYSNFYNLSSIIWGLLDVVFGGLAIVATSLVFLSTISSAFKCKILTLGKIGGKVINLQKVQSTLQTINSNTKVKKLLQVLGFGGIIYIISRGKKFLKEIKNMFKKIWNGIKYVVKYVFGTNPITIFCGFGGLALLIYNGASGGVIINFILTNIDGLDVAGAEALFYSVGGSSTLLAIVKQGLETITQKQKRIAEAKAEAKVVADEKAKAEADAILEAEAKAAVEAENLARIAAKKAELLAAQNTQA